MDVDQKYCDVMLYSLYLSCMDVANATRHAKAFNFATIESSHGCFSMLVHFVKIVWVIAEWI